MNEAKNNLNKLLLLSHAHSFTKHIRRLNNLSYNYINIIISLYILQVLKQQLNITLTDISRFIEYLEYNKVKLFISFLIPEYIIRYEGKHSYYKLSNRGIGLIDDILKNYDTVFRSILEKHKLNELF